MWDYKLFLENAAARISAIILLTALLIELFYIVYFYFKASFGKIENKEEPTPPVSVIITEKNEAHNLEKFLPLILKQDYPDFEVIVVNHASEDQSDLILKRFSYEYKNLVIRNIPHSDASTHTKKFALTVGIRAARNDVLLFTDADCYPASDQWIRKMVSHFDNDTQIVLGYGAYEQGRGVLDKHLRTDTVFIAMQYFGFAMRGLPYMGVGRNIAWRKSFFEKKGGFQAHIFEPSGSDDIFVNHNGNKQNTRIELDPQGMTISIAPENWKLWVFQKHRHLGAAKYYRTKYKILLAIEPLSRVIFLLGAIIVSAIFNNFLPLSALILREILFITAMYGITRRLREKGILLYSVLYDIYQPFLNFFLYLGRKKHTATQWK